MIQKIIFQTATTNFRSDAIKRLRGYHGPINTVGKPTTIVPPWTVKSPMRAAGMPPINTVGDPGGAIASGGPTQVAISPTRAAGMPPMSTVGHPGGKIGPPTCGIGGTPGVTIGQVCMSEARAAGFPMPYSPLYP
jgi:hypothetical protein